MSEQVERAAKLRLLADRVEDGTLGCLTLNTLGDVFGNDFWNLIVYLVVDELHALNPYSTLARLIDKARREDEESWAKLVAYAQEHWPMETGRNVADVFIEKTNAARAALAPFAARVHADGIDAPYPEDEWKPELQAAANWIKSA